MTYGGEMILLLAGVAHAQDCASSPTAAVPLAVGGCPSPFVLRFERDVPHLALGVGLLGVTTALPELVPARRPTVAATSPGFYPDTLFGELAFEGDHAWAAPTSNVLAAGTAALSLLVPLETGEGAAARNLGRSLIQTEVLLVSTAATSALKLAVRGSRPFVQAGTCTDLGDDTLACASNGETRYVSYADATASFPSGHTSMAAAATFGWATVRLRATDRKITWDDVLLYGLATGLTTATGFARVEAGVHHPTDVIAGGLLGAAFGIGIPLLH